MSEVMKSGEERRRRGKVARRKSIFMDIRALSMVDLRLQRFKGYRYSKWRGCGGRRRGRHKGRG